MNKWQRLGERFGKAVAASLTVDVKDRIRKVFADAFGACRICKAPLGGHSPDQVCNDCHASEMLQEALGTKPDPRTPNVC